GIRDFHVTGVQTCALPIFSGQNVTKILDTAVEITRERTKELKTSQLNVWLGERTNHHPPAGLKNKHPRLRYMTQTGTNPPEFARSEERRVGKGGRSGGDAV